VGGKIDVYHIGLGGVNLTKSPIHLDDAELTQAQNAEFDSDSREGGLRKRGGIDEFTPTALNSGASILGMSYLPLPTTYVLTLYASLDSGANTWLTSTNGTTYTGVTTPARAARIDVRTTPVLQPYGHRRITTFNNKLVYPGDDYVVYPTLNFTSPPLRLYDGTDDVEILRLQVGPDAAALALPYSLLDFVKVGGTLYFTVHEQLGSTNGGRVLSMDLTTGIIAQVGETFGGTSISPTAGAPYTLVSHRGDIFVGINGIAGASVGKIYRITPGGTNSWTADVTNLQGYPISMAEFQGDLYVGLQGDAGENALVVKRAAATGAYTTSDTGSGVVAFSYYGPLIVFEDELYTPFISPDPVAASVVSTIRKFDGTSWTTDLDIKGTLTPSGVTNFGVHKAGQATIFNGDLYIAFETNVGSANGFILKKASGGAWSIAEDGIEISGYLEVLNVRS